jgi:hypothetical protein
MNQEIGLIFHNRGLRSYIELELCRECPRQDAKGCCAYYAPVFYPLDLGFLYQHKPELIDFIFSLHPLTVLDTSVTVNNGPEEDSYRCRFHSKETGCLLEQEWRESVCRQFVCPGVGWWEEVSLAPWNDFFTRLVDYEVACNQQLSAQLTERGLSLRDPAGREAFLAALPPLCQAVLAQKPDFFSSCPETETVRLVRDVSKTKKDWRL